MNKNMLNVVLIVGVIGLVAGVAWYKSTTQGDAPVPSASPAQNVAETREEPEAPPPSPGENAVAAAELKPAAAPVQAEPVKLPRLIDLGADKCIPCKKLAPILEELKKEYAGRLDVVFIDVWKHPDLGKPYEYNLIPTQILLDAEGQEVWRHVGFIAKEELKALFAEKVGVK